MRYYLDFEKDIWQITDDCSEFNIIAYNSDTHSYGMTDDDFGEYSVDMFDDESIRFGFTELTEDEVFLELI